jgi:diaminopimelate epimerase
VTALIALNFDETQKADLVMLYKNPDGSDAGMCGNGARCFARFALTLWAHPENLPSVFMTMCTKPA